MAQALAKTTQTATSEILPKPKAILDAAVAIFLRDGFRGASMDRIAAQAVVSKQTVYAHFQSKEALFVAVVRSMTGEAGELLSVKFSDPKSESELAEQLRYFGERRLLAVLTARNMKFARLVISETGRFPEFGKALYESGTKLEIEFLASAIGHWRELGLLDVDDPVVAATHFKGMLMSEFLQRALFLGGEGVPSKQEVSQRVSQCVEVFLELYRAPE